MKHGAVQKPKQTKVMTTKSVPSKNCENVVSLNVTTALIEDMNEGVRVQARKKRIAGLSGCPLWALENSSLFGGHNKINYLLAM